jgi:hypothetical protein
VNVGFEWEAPVQVGGAVGWRDGVFAGSLWWWVGCVVVGVVGFGGL